MNIKNTIRRLANAQANKDAQPLPRASIKREASLSELNAEYRQQGYGLHFCFHNKTYYEVCTACKRTRRDAERNLSQL
jgi:hypothetical protein